MPRILIGTVVSDKMDKTISVSVARQKNHRLYHKQYQVTKKYLAHDEENQAKTGDVVELTESRPLSRRKRWQLSKIVEKAEQTE